MVFVLQIKQFGLWQSLFFQGSLFVIRSSIFLPDLSTTLTLSPVVSASFVSLSLKIVASLLSMVCGMKIIDFNSLLSPSLFSLFSFPDLFQGNGCLDFSGTVVLPCCPYSSSCLLLYHVSLSSRSFFILDSTVVSASL